MARAAPASVRRGNRHPPWSRGIKFNSCVWNTATPFLYLLHKQPKAVSAFDPLFSPLCPREHPQARPPIDDKIPVVDPPRETEGAKHESKVQGVQTGVFFLSSVCRVKEVRSSKPGCRIVLCFLFRNDRWRYCCTSGWEKRYRCSGPLSCSLGCIPLTHKHD